MSGDSRARDAEPRFPRLVTIADALTEAMEMGAQLARAGLAVSLLIEPACRTGGGGGRRRGEEDGGESGQGGSAPGTAGGRDGSWDVLVLDTESRHLSAEEAYRQVRQVVAASRSAFLTRIPALIFYRQMGSTWLDNGGAEIRAVMDAMDLPLALVVSPGPFPAPVAAGGVQRIQGTALHQADSMRYLLTQADEDSLMALLARQTSYPLTRLPRQQVEQGFLAVAEFLTAEAARAGRTGRRMVCYDAGSDEDLRTIVRAALHLGRPLFLVGTAPLSRWLSLELGQRRSKGEGAMGDGGMTGGWPRDAAAEVAPGARRRHPGGVLAICGSRHGVARRQIMWASRQRGVGLARVEPVELAVWGQGEGPAPGSLPTLIRVITESLAAGRHILLTIGSLRIVPFSQNRAEAVQQLRRAVAAGMGKTAAAILASGRAGGLIAMGSEIAFRVACQLEAAFLRVEGELQPGIPFGWFQDGLCPALPFVMKSGASGGDDILYRAIRFLSEK